MSLIVAKKDGNSVFIVSDTKLSFSNTGFRGQENLVRYGTIKTIIVNPKLCISFATEDNAIQVGDVIKSITVDSSVQEALRILHDEHVKMSFRTEFIVVGGDNDIYAIKNGKTEPTNSAWIGCVEGFNKFQEKFLSDQRQDTEVVGIGHIQIMSASASPVFDKMSSAIDHVIGDESIKTVGGFKVCVQNREGLFRYKFYMQMYKLPITVDASMQGLHVIGHDSAALGGYTINFLGTSANNQHLAIHLKQGDLGIVYSRIDGGIMWPKIFSKMDEIDFQDHIASVYKINSAFSTQDRCTKYKTGGLDLFNQKRYLEAIQQFDKGIHCDNGRFKAELLFYKGIALLNLDRIREGFGTFTMAMQEDSSYEQKIIQVFEQRTINILRQNGIIK